MSIDKSAIVTEFGAYYKAGGENEKRLKRLYLYGKETTKIAVPIKTDDTIYRMAKSRLTSLVQGFQKAFTPKGELIFTPKTIQLFKLKVDFEVYPDEIEDNWLGFLASKSLTRSEWPLIRYILEEHFYKQVEDDMERNVYYKGVYDEPVSGEAGLSGASMNGLKYLLENGNQNRLEMDALDAATIYDQLEAAYEQIAEEYQNEPMVICMSNKWHRAFLKDKRSLGYYDMKSSTEIDNSLDFSPARVKGLLSMTGTNDIFITPESNFLHITKKGENAAKVKVEESKRCVAIMTDWWEGLGFGIDELVWTNVAVPEPPAEG